MTAPSLTVLVIVGASLLMASVIASKASSRFGIPALLLFLVVGMLAGSDGPGGIPFDNPPLAQAIGIIGLVLILFAGGLETRWSDVRPVLRPALLLSTLGVGITAAVTGWFAAWILGWRFLDGLLLGAIVSSTDAAAVFAVLRSRNVHLPNRLRSLLEFESGSNDPMAVFLTVALIQLASSSGTTIGQLPLMFLRQMALGGLLGYGAGRAMAFLVNRVQLEYDGLYPVLTLGMVLLTYGLTDAVQGNGFLAVYLAGMFMRRGLVVHKRSLIRFHDGLAWLMQIVMFLTLGLQVFPARLVGLAAGGSAIALFLMVVSRPLAVFVVLWRTRITLRERGFIGWVGLRGAAPIILATFPLVAELPAAQTIFHVVFFIVLTSALLQGSSIPWAARALGLATADAGSTSDPLELIASSGSEPVEFAVPDTPAFSGRRLVDLGLPEGALVVLVRRGDSVFVPSGVTSIRGGDRLVVLANREQSGTVRSVFEQEQEPEAG